MLQKLKSIFFKVKQRIQKPTEVVFEEGNYRVIEKYDGPKLLERKRYYMGRGHGLHEAYWDNGNLRREVNYEFGYLQGICKFYHMNGKVHSVVFYEKGKRNKIEVIKNKESKTIFRVYHLNIK
jgi:antitoxin component YwqK of YwqJK toxin-antitoxin module